ncbi:ribonuclease H2, subunit C [Xylariaceae sp. FL0016]|nr:ribonuclease H2, subunit C [Xylariaceae sp. FL0016]
MTPPVFSVGTDEGSEKKATVHLLPCRIHHDGNVDPSDVYWSPSEVQDGHKTAYVRGRKLHGKATRLPEGYYGSVVVKSETQPEPQSPREMTEDVEIIEDPNDELQVGAMQSKATFHEVVVWDHETTADPIADPYLRSMEEWVSFAAKIHSSEADSSLSAK